MSLCFGRMGGNGWQAITRINSEKATATGRLDAGFYNLQLPTHSGHGKIYVCCHCSGDYRGQGAPHQSDGEILGTTCFSPFSIKEQTERKSFTEKYVVIYVQNTIYKR